ncbi:lipoprotein [Ponticaulis sp.]|uniref:LPS translocon maturation chaperone LptM n=1 Tax=Ponticaulis sp. TaxID=2020902 RepID=UPI000B6EFBBE|nr:lipoprotein [Ponticaulis sp.]MAI89836.1 hypothetical protein [Ponticaulis sp.]OUX99511.1 MAG: hypothetical protein CBB65_05295 [Hyphomonadaceae bacterium TMED5]|tara:strand:- start:68550 stop:68861 length:312 start_codon:yes stop_codon:yes gene_type:complete
MKRIAFFTAAIALTSLSACGLRGDLERPDPLWGDPPPAEEEVAEAQPAPELRPRSEPEHPAGTSYRDPETGETVWAQNEGGGVVPLSAPTTDIQEEELPPLAE